ncbi:Mu-like prophage I protein [Azospirillum lipoferum]|nr:Mu-like prophage I protein [Azospirillum lipoferum]
MPSLTETSVCSALTMPLPGDGKAPEWVQLLPAGNVQPNDGRPGWMLKDAGAVIAASMASAPHGLLAIDYDHAADLAAPKGGTAPAAGWITALESRDGGIWGKVDWTLSGSHAIASKEYRFLSPSFQHTPDRAVTRIIGAGLTNRPALTMLPALASSQGDTMNSTLLAILEALGLPGNADHAAILATIAKLKDGTSTATASAIPDPALYVPRALYDEASTALASVRSSIVDGQAVAKVDAAICAGKITPAQREWGLALCRQNPDSFDAFASVAPAAFAKLSRETLPGVGPSDPAVSNHLTADQLALCKSMGLDPADYAKNL